MLAHSIYGHVGYDVDICWCLNLYSRIKGIPDIIYKLVAISGISVHIAAYSSGHQTLKKLEVSAYIAEHQKQIDSERICSIKDIRIISWPKNRLPDDALKIGIIL